MPQSNKIVIPTITPYSLRDIVDESAKFENNYSTIHFDVIDLSYGTPTYFDEVEIEKNLRNYSKVVIHLMVANPTMYLINRKDRLDHQKNLFIIPFKKVNFMNIEALKKQGFRIGLSFELGDSCEIDPTLIQSVEEFLFLPIVPGATGRNPDLNFLTKMDLFYNKYRLEFYKNITVSIDGGFTEMNATEYLETHASVIYANSFFSKYSLAESLAKLRSINAYYNTKLNQD